MEKGDGQNDRKMDKQKHINRKMDRQMIDRQKVIVNTPEKDKAVGFQICKNSSFVQLVPFRKKKTKNKQKTLHNKREHLLLEIKRKNTN